MKTSDLDRYLAQSYEHDDEPRDTLKATQRLMEAAEEHERAMRDQARARDIIRATRTELAVTMGELGMTEQEAVNYLQARDSAASALALIFENARTLHDEALAQEAVAIGASPWLASAALRQDERKEMKCSPLEVKFDEGTARFSGLASPFGGKPDAVGDLVEPGAYKTTLAEAEARGGRFKFPVLWQHDTKQPLGGIISAVERPDGLHVEGQLAIDTELGKYAYSLMSKHMISGLSIGFITRKDRYVGAIRHLLAIELLEVSIVTLPAAPLARIDAL